MNSMTGDRVNASKRTLTARVENPRSDSYRHQQNLGLIPGGQALTMIRAI